jgi:hypothetical protein
MNLIRGGCPRHAIRPEQHKTSLETLERVLLADDLQPFRTFTHERLDATLGRRHLQRSPSLRPQQACVDSEAVRSV